jgi:hypothetical protein
MTNDRWMFLEKIWQCFEPVEGSDTMETLLSRLNQQSIREKKRLVVKIMLASAGLLIFGAIVLLGWLRLGEFSWWLASGLGIVFFSTFAFMVMALKWQSWLRPGDLAKPMLEFIPFAIKRFELQQSFLKIGAPIYAALMIFGVNLLVPGFLYDKTLNKQLLYHFIISVIILCAVRIGIKVRIRFFERDVRPLIRELKNADSDS